MSLEALPFVDVVVDDDAAAAAAAATAAVGVNVNTF